MEPAWLVWVILVSIGFILWVLFGRTIILKFVIKERSVTNTHVKDKHKNFRTLINKSLIYSKDSIIPITTDPIPDEIWKAREEDEEWKN